MLSRVTHKLTNLLDRVSQIRPCKCHILQSPNHTPIGSRIRKQRTILKVDMNCRKACSKARFAVQHIKFGEQIQGILGLMHKQALRSILDLKSKKVSKGTKIFQIKGSTKSGNKMINEWKTITSNNDVIHIKKKVNHKGNMMQKIGRAHV